jgi:hypothetical protein
MYGGWALFNSQVKIATKTYGGGTEEERIPINGGFGGGGGIFALIPFFGIYFAPEISYQRRNLLDSFGDTGDHFCGSAIGINCDNYLSLTVTEDLIHIPLLFRFRYREENIIYLGVGPFLDILLNVKDNIDGTFKKYCANPDYGLVYELGFLISDGFSVDIRGAMSMGKFDAGKYLAERNSSYSSSGSSVLYHYQIGVNYAF